MASLLPNLAPDVIFSIFAFCDISSVISASQTCQYLHNLAFDKSVWLGLLDNLRRRSILDRTVNLETLSVAEMIGIVRRLITGPQTWSPAELDRDPVAEVSKMITLHVRSARASGPRNFVLSSVKLLSSGCYVLLRIQDTLEFWNVAHDRLVWRHTPAGERTVLVNFGAEETADTESAIVIMVFLRGDLPGGPMHFLEMVNVDLRTGTHNCLLVARAPYSELLDQPAICGALASVRLKSGYMIINWKANSYFMIRGHDSHSRFALIPGHIVALMSSVNEELQIHLISNDTIGPFFSPTIGLDDATEFSAASVEEMPKLHIFRAIGTKLSFWGSVQIHASPVRDTDYRVWIRGANEGLLSYQLSIPIDREPQCRLRKALRPGSQLASYSGHALHYEAFRGGWTVMSPGPSSANPRLQLFDDVEFVDLATYSGALTCLAADSPTVIQYYK